MYCTEFDRNRSSTLSGKENNEREMKLSGRGLGGGGFQLFGSCLKLTKTVPVYCDDQILGCGGNSNSGESLSVGRLILKCDGTRAETRFCLSAQRTSPFKSTGAFVQSTTGSRCVRISGSNAGYTMFQRLCEGYWLPTPFGNFPFTSPPVRHRVPSRFNWTVPKPTNSI